MEAFIKLRDESAGRRSRVSICMSRGGLVTHFFVDDQAILFLDEVTLRDPTKNVRGGIPVLFPTPGKLIDDTWAWRGRTGQLRQHGFARELRWTSDTPALDRVTARLSWPGDADWPWPCELAMTYTLRGNTLRLDQRVTNHGDEEMPYGLGFHPYFFVRQADKSKVKIPTAATRAFDNTEKREVALDPAGIDLTKKEVDLHLIAHGGSSATLVREQRTIRISGSAEYKHWVIWTLADRDFVCLEPWTSPGNALNKDEDVLILAPRASRDHFIEIEAGDLV